MDKHNRKIHSMEEDSQMTYVAGSCNGEQNKSHKTILHEYSHTVKKKKQAKTVVEVRIITTPGVSGY